jgi:hypothetical protein
MTTHASPSSVADAIIAAEQARGAALREADIAALERLIHPQMRYVHSNGRVELREEILAGFRSGEVSFPRFITSHHHVQPITESVAVLTGQIDQTKVIGPRQVSIRLLFQAVWQREDVGWRVIAFQSAVAPQG